MAIGGVGCHHLGCWWGSAWRSKENDVERILWLPTAIAVIVGIVVLLDWLGRRKERQSRDRAA
jgi:hypothetical protein